MLFSMFFRDLFFNEFSMAFLMETGSRNGPISFPGTTLLAPFSRPFPKIDFYMHFGRPLAPCWLPFGSLCLPFGSLWLPFGTIWLPFGSLCLPFGSLWFSFGSQISERTFCFEHFQQSTRRQYHAPWPSHPTVLKGPERNLAAGNLD